MIDYTKTERTSVASSNKVLLQGSGSFDVPSIGASSEVGTGTAIAHNYGSDNLLFQVVVWSNSAGAVLEAVRLPWGSGDNRLFVYTSLDATNLYISAVSSNSGTGSIPDRLIQFSYRILVP